MLLLQLNVFFAKKTHFNKLKSKSSQTTPTYLQQLITTFFFLYTLAPLTHFFQWLLQLIHPHPPNSYINHTTKPLDKSQNMKRFIVMLFFLLTSMCAAQLNFSTGWPKRNIEEGNCKTSVDSLMVIYKLIQVSDDFFFVVCLVISSYFSFFFF